MSEVSFLSAFGLLALVVIALAVCCALVAEGIGWWRNREMRRWPNDGEWQALQQVTCYPLKYDERTTKRAKVAYRKLRYKYGRKVG